MADLAGNLLAAESGFLKLQPAVDIQHLDPDTLSRFLRMAREYHDTTGNTIQVNSGYRSIEKQAQLHAQDPVRNAPPGRSMHNYGYALDLQSTDAERLEKAGLLRKYGFWRALMGPKVKNKEAWHIERQGLDYAAVRASRGFRLATRGGAVLLVAVLIAGIYLLFQSTPR